MKRIRKKPDSEGAGALSVEAMRPPGDYTESEARIWRETFEQLKALRTLSASDCCCLDLFARTFAELLRLEGDLKAEGACYTAGARMYANPKLAQRNDCRREARALMQQLGITPLSRGSVRPSRSATKNIFAIN